MAEALEGFGPIRGRLSIRDGALVRREQVTYQILRVIDIESVLGRDLESGRSVVLRIAELRPVHQEGEVLEALTTDPEDISDDDWRTAKERFAAIEPLAGKQTVGRAEAEARAGEVGVHVATLYRWLRRYDAYGAVSALIPRKRGWTEGKSRLKSHVEGIIQDVIHDFYLTVQRPTAQQAVTEVLRRCDEQDVELPSESSIRARLARIPEREMLRLRGFREKAMGKFVPAPGKFPNADYPLAVVQIDHTPADIILVDDAFRKPIGRPFITLAIDVYSRVIAGYYLSFDAPSETSLAMCMASAVLPKADWLRSLGVEAEWPVSGIPVTVHADNGSDFRSNNFQHSCLGYTINVEFRPLGRPHFGGTVERVFGTLLQDIHSLPGTTFSSIKDKEGYDSEKKATMTISEFEKWLVTWICKVYHQNVHSTIGMTPLKKWELGLFGDGETPGTGIPPLPADPMTFFRDFLPSFRRTVQPTGVTVEGCAYYSEALRPWIGALDEETGKKRQFVFRRDPRNISHLWFYDPLLKEYFEIPFADQALPVMSAWENKQAKERLRREGLKNPTQRDMLRGLTELRELAETSQKHTKKARRQVQRRKEHAKGISPANPFPQERNPLVGEPLAADLADGDIEPFGLIE